MNVRETWKYIKAQVQELKSRHILAIRSLPVPSHVRNARKIVAAHRRLDNRHYERERNRIVKQANIIMMTLALGREKDALRLLQRFQHPKRHV